MPDIDPFEAVPHDPFDPRPLREQNPSEYARFTRERRAQEARIKRERDAAYEAAKRRWRNAGI